ncbi:Serine/threonine-protein kinase minibrain [Pelomyxa schiedti]|nr:Serine/threonine-protein kinase minibrain [Pelomyxa schiedti]
MMGDAMRQTKVTDGKCDCSHSEEESTSRAQITQTTSEHIDTVVPSDSASTHVYVSASASASAPNVMPVSKEVSDILQKHVPDAFCMAYGLDTIAKKETTTPQNFVATTTASAAPPTPISPAITNYVGLTLNSRFSVLGEIGHGAFGQVLRALDTTYSTALPLSDSNNQPTEPSSCPESNLSATTTSHKLSHKEVAIKITNTDKHSHTHAKNEAAAVAYLNSYDPHDQYHIVRYIDTFQFGSSICTVFELLSHNLYEMILKYPHGIALLPIRKIARQLLIALEFLKSWQMIHTDIRPENILLNPTAGDWSIKLIDFGNATSGAKPKILKYIQSRFYRAPEVLLGVPCSYPIDMWSLGCVLVELHTGVPLFCGRTETDQLLKIVEILGVPPFQMIEDASNLKSIFHQEGCTYEVSKEHRSGLSYNTLGKIIGVERHSVDPTYGITATYTHFLDFVRKTVDYNPATRITPEQGRHHPLLQNIA